MEVNHLEKKDKIAIKDVLTKHKYCLHITYITWFDGRYSMQVGYEDEVVARRHFDNYKTSVKRHIAACYWYGQNGIIDHFDMDMYHTNKELSLKEVK